MAEEVGSLRVGLSIDSAKFEQSMASVDRNLKALGQEMAIVRAKGNEWGSSIEGLGSKQKSLSTLLDSQDVKVRKLNEAYQTAVTEQGANSKAAENLAIKLNKATAEYTKTETELGKVSSELRKQKDELKKNESSWTKLSQVASSASDKLHSAGEKMKGIGQGLTTGVTLPILGLGVASAKVAIDFEAQMDRVGAIADATAGDMERLSETALELGANTSKSASEVAKGMEEMAAMGFTANEIIGAMPGVISAAEASGSDMAQTAEVMASTLNIFGLEASKANDVADILAKTANISAASLTDMQYALKYAGPPAAALGISLEELSAGIGIMTNAGMKGEQAGTTLRSALLGLLDPSEENSKMMTKMGIAITDNEGNFVGLSNLITNLQTAMAGQTETQKAATLSALVGKEAVSGMLSLMSAGPAEIDKMTLALEESGGASETAAAKMRDNLKGALDELGGAFETAGISIGNILAPAIQKVADSLQGLVTKFLEMSPTMQNLTLIIAGIAAVIGPLLIAFGFLSMSISSIMGLLAPLIASIASAGGIVAFLSAKLASLGTFFAALTGPVGLTILAITGIIAALVLAYNKVDWFRDVVNKAWDAIKSATSTAFNAVKNIMSTVISAAVKFGSEQLSKFKAFWDENGAQITAGVKFYFNAISSYIKVIMAVIKGVFEQVWPIIYHAVRIALEAIKLVIGNVMTLVLGIIQTALKLLKGDWSGAWDTIKQTTIKMMLGVVDFLRAVDLKQVGIDIIRGLIKGITSMVKGVTGAIKDIAGSIPEWAKKVLGIKSPSRVMYAIGEWTGIGMANGITSTKAHNEAVMNELGTVIKNVAKANASEIAAINKTASAEQKAIASKAAADIANIHAIAADYKRKLTGNEVRRIQKIEDEADAKILANKNKHKAEVAKIEASTSKERLDAVKQFLDEKRGLEQLSLIEEVNVWRQAAMSFKEGTQEKIAANIEYRNALEKVNAEITSINETYAGKMADINERLQSQEAELTKTYMDSLDSRSKSLMSFAGLFDTFDVKVEKSGSELLSNLNAQVDGFKLWQTEIEKLSGKAIDEGLLAELREMGPAALPELLALNSLTAEQLTQYSGLYQEKAKLARTQAEAELVGMKADTALRITELRATANAELAKLQTEWTLKIQSVTKATNDEFKTLTQIGVSAGQNLLNGLASMQPALVAQATAIAQAVNAALQSTLGGSVNVPNVGKINSTVKSTATPTARVAAVSSQGTSSSKSIQTSIVQHFNVPVVSAADNARKLMQTQRQMALEWG